jgi:hypothetical protein
MSAKGVMMRPSLDGLDDSVSDERGRFTLRNVSPGPLTLLGLPPLGARDGGMVRAERTIEGTGTVDIGDVELEKRAK